MLRKQQFAIQSANFASFAKQVSFERLAQLKEYRTPQLFRAFARVFILCIGALYGPYYVHLGRGAAGYVFF